MSGASGSGRRVDLRWGRVSLAQLQDEDFLIKQLRRLQSLDAFSRKRRHATGASTDRGPRSSSSVFSTPLPSRLSLQARLARGPVPPPSTGETTDADGHVPDKRPDAPSEQETEDMNALFVLGSLDQPELTALMIRQLKDLLARNCSFVDPFSTLVALRKYIVENVHAAVVAQHQQHQAAVEFTEKMMASSRLESASSASNGLSIKSLAGDPSAPGDALSTKPKEKGIREAAVGVRFMLSVLTSLLDLSSGSPPQKREILGELLPLVSSIAPLSLVPKQPETHASANGELDEAPSMGSNLETQELVERLQQFFLHMCAGSVRHGPTSPKVLAVASAADRDLTDRTQAMNGLIHLAAARASLRDFLLVLKVILGVSEMSIGDYKDTPAPISPRTCVQSPPALSSQLTASAPLLKTARYDQESDLVSDNNTPMDLKAGILPDIGVKSSKPSRFGDSDPTSLMETTNLVQQVKRKALPKGFVPKVVGTTSTMTVVNHTTVVHPSSVHRLLSSTETVIAVPTAPPRNKSRVKDDTRDINLNLSFDLSTVQQDATSRHGEPTSRFTRRDPVVTARCPKFKPLDVVSVLQELDHAKPCASSRIASSRIHRTSHNNPEDCEIRAAALVGLGDEDSDDREVWSCGQNSYGELGHGDTTTRNTFERIESLQRKDVIQISAGNEHSIALCADGSVWTCGYNDNGQCGHGTTTRVVHMSEITKIGGQLIVQVHAYNGCEHSILVTQDGKVATCGYNYRGQLGHGSTTSEPIPKIVRSLETKHVRLVSCSYYHTMMTCEGDGGRDIVYTFGRNDYGQLGHDDTADRKVPQQVDALGDRRIVSVACGQYHSMVVTATGRVFAFGKNDYGQLGLDTIDNQLVPAQVKGGLEKQTCLEIRCGYYHSIVLCSGSRVYGFGRNDYGQLGLGRSNATASANVQLQQQRFALPQLIEELEGKDIARIACGCYHTVVVCEDGMLYVFGRNNHGQLGTGDTNERLYPFPVDDFVGKHVATVAAGFYHTMVLTGNKEEDKREDANENEMEDLTKSADLNCDVITHSSILSSVSCRRILMGKSTTGGSDTVNNSTCDCEDDKRDEDDGGEDRAHINIFPKSCDESHTHLTSTSPSETRVLASGADSLEVAVIILAELDRLCRPFIPKNSVYPILQYPAVQTMEVILTCPTSPSILNVSELFTGCFELYAVDVCSSTFTSLCLLLKYLSCRTLDSLAQTHYALQGSRNTSASAKSSRLQLYMILVCLRLLQANLAQCLRSGCAKAMLMYAHAKEVNNAEGSSEAANAEMENMIASLPHIREVLFMLIDLKSRRALCSTTDSMNEDATAARITEEATDTLMIAFELLFPCQCSQMKLFEFVIDCQANRSFNSSCNYCSRIIWRPDILPKYRKIFLVPLFRRLADDSLMMKLLPTLTTNMPKTRNFVLQNFVTLYTGVLEYVSVDFTRIVGSSESKLRTPLQVFSKAGDLSNDASIALLLAIGKHVSSWASSCSEWKLTFKSPDGLRFEERIACLVDRVLRVDESDLNHLPAPWHCFLEFSSAIIMQCCDVILQVLSREPVPSPTFRTRSLSSEHERLHSLSLELLGLSLVGKLLPSLISSLSAFSGKSLFAATLLPKINDLLRLVDEFNRSCDGEGLVDSEKKFTDTITTSSHSETPRSNTGSANNVSLPPPYLSGVPLDVCEKRISDTMTLPWNFLLEKKLAKLAAEMIVTLVKGDPFFSLGFLGAKEEESIPSRWLSNAIFKGGLDPDFIRQSVLKTHESANPISSPEFRIVKHLPFRQIGYNEKAPFSVILPPAANAYKSCVEYPTSFSLTGSVETYLQLCSARSIRGFLRALSSDLSASADRSWTPARQFCDWIRDYYSRTDATYRMLVRTRLMTQQNQVSASQAQSTETNMEYAFFADLVHHYGLSLVALHWTLRRESSQAPPPRIFIDLWSHVAELRRRFATKKTELKMVLPDDDAQISRLQQTILERCQLLLLLKVSVHSDYSCTSVHRDYIAPHDPAVSSSYEIASDRAVKHHMTATYTIMKLPFLAAYPKSKWRIIRIFVHVIARWRALTKCTSQMKNGMRPALELLDFVTADEDISALSALNIMLVDPCRRASSSIHGYEHLRETLALITFESIQVDILHHTSQSLVFDRQHAIQSVVSNESQHIGGFYSLLRSDALVDFLVQITDMIVERSTQLLDAGGQDDRVLFLCILLSCWGTHFKTNQFEFVSDTGILAVLQQLSLAITNITSRVCQPKNCSADVSVNGATREISDSINGLFIRDRSHSKSKTLERLKEVLWTLFRYICVHFSVRHIRLNRLSESHMICTPIRPVLSSTFDLLYSAMTLMIDECFAPLSLPSSSQFDVEANEGGELGGSLESALPTKTGTIASGVRRSFEIIVAPRGFSAFRKGLTFSYDAMISPEQSRDDNIQAPMSQLLKYNEFSITSWIFINDVANTSAELTRDPQFVFMRGNDREISPYMVLVPEGPGVWHVEIGLILKMSNESTITSLRHLAWERLISKECIPSSKWIHIAIVMESTKIRFYINGMLDSQRSISTSQSTAWVTDSVDLPFHFGRFANAKRTESAESPIQAIVASSILLSASLALINSGSGKHTGVPSHTMLKSFDGQLSHFRFHNRSLSPIHVRIVFDEKKQLLSLNGDVCSSSVTSTPNQIKLYEMCALLLPLALSSEGQFEFQAKGSRWLQVLWSAFLHSPTLKLQQAVLRVMRISLKLCTPHQASDVLLSTKTYDVDSLLTWGFEKKEDIFAQQIIRIIGFCVSQCPAVPEGKDFVVEQQRHLPEVPICLTFPIGVHGNMYCASKYYCAFGGERKIVLRENKSDRFHSFVIGNELQALLQDLHVSNGGNTLWSSSIQRALLRCFKIDDKAENTDCSQSQSVLRIGNGLALLSDIKNLEMIGSLYCFNGPVDTLRSGAIVELVQTGERAQVVSLAGDDWVRPGRTLLNSATSSPQTGDSIVANVVIQTNGIPHHEQYQNQPPSHENSAMWFDQVMSRLFVLEGHGSTPSDGIGTRYAQLSVHDIQPAFEHLSAFFASSSKTLVNQGDLLRILLQYTQMSGSDFLFSCSPIPMQITDKYLVEMQKRCFALKALVQLSQADWATPEFLNNEHLITMVMDSSILNDGIDTFTTLDMAERNLWMLRERIFNILVDLEDEGPAELEQCGKSNSDVTDLAQSFPPDSTWILNDDADSSKEIEHIEIPYLNAIDSSEEPCESGEDDTGDLQEEPMDRALVYTEREDEDEDGEENDEEDEDEDEEDENDNDDADDAEESRAEFVDELMLMGFPEEWCVLALKQTENDIVSASAWIVDNLEYLSRLQSSLDQQRDQGVESPMCNEEDDVNTGDDVLEFQINDAGHRPLIPDYTLNSSTPTHEAYSDKNSTICNISESCEQLPPLPQVNDKEMGRKVFGEMYFPFEDGGFDSNMKSSYMYLWRSSAIETQIAAEMKSVDTVDSPTDILEPSTSLVRGRTQFLHEIRQMDLSDLITLLHTYGRAFSVLHVRLCAVSMWVFTVPTLNENDLTDVSLPNGLSYQNLFALLKLVLYRGEQYSNSFDQSIRGGNAWIKTVMGSVVSYRLKVDFEAFSYAVIEFCITELERAASSKVYEAFLWTQRDLKRVDRVAIEEPAVELVGWLMEKLFDDNVALLSMQIVAQTLLRLRYCLKSSNLPLKFIILQTMSRVLRQQSRKGLDNHILTDSRLLFEDFLHAAKQRYIRELVQHRLLFSRYLQAYIEILHLIFAIKQLSRDISLESGDAAQPILNPTVFQINPQTEFSNTFSPSIIFDRKRCRSSLLTISSDDLSVVYSGHEIWKTVFGNVCCSTGVTSWQIRIEKSSSSYLFVGVASHRASADSFLGADEHSWGYIGDKALYYQRNRVKSYGEGFGEGDIIGVRVDSEQGTLSFSKNGVDLGIAFENIVGEVYPAVSFHTRHQKVSMIQGIVERLPTNGNADSAATQYDSDRIRDSSYTHSNMNECGNIEECLLVCEMMNWMVDSRLSLRPLVLRSAYEMTQQWLLGTKKYVTTRAGKPLWVDVTKEVCSPFGFQAKDRVRTPRGNGTVAGVAESRIWVDVDGEDGAWFFHPSKLRPLTIISVSNTSGPYNVVNAESNASSKGTDKTLREANENVSCCLNDLSYEQFTEQALEMHWNLKIDRVLLSLINDHCDTSSESPWNISPSNLLAIVRSKHQELLAAVEAQFPNVSFTTQTMETMCIIRMGFLRFFNAYFSRVTSYFDMTWHYFSPKSSLVPCYLASQCRGSIFTSIKNELFTLLMEKTANAPKKADDDYDYPDDLPQLLINRPKAATAKCHPGSLKSLFLSIFGQAFDQLHFLPVKMIRMVYSHPMDDGQLRCFKVKFEGEGVDDYGGPYREFFSQFFADLQMLRDASGEDRCDTEQRAKDSTPTSCLLPFLIPSPNWRNGVGANREKFVLNAALLSKSGNKSINVKQSVEKDSNESDIERQQVHAEMFHFFGQMLGTCLRTRVCVRLDLAISVWQQLVGEDSDADRDTSLQTLKEVDFPAYTLWKSLYEMHEQYIRHPPSSESARDLREQLEAMDLAFTTFLSDGREIELCAHGADKSVTMDNIDEYLDAVLTERMQEARDVISIMKQGINTVVPVTALSLFTWQELEKRVCGVANVDVSLLRRNTEYDEDVSPGDEFVQRFWRVLESMEEEDKRAFLRFVWARSRLPVGAAQFHQKFKLQSLSPSSNRSGTESASTTSASGNSAWMDSQLPKSHTCFFALQLPRYSSDEICRKQLLYAVRNCVEMDGDFRLADTEMTGWNDINPNDQLRF